MFVNDAALLAELVEQLQRLILEKDIERRFGQEQSYDGGKLVYIDLMG